MPDIRTMIGKEVEVVANGVSYRGILQEVSDTEVYIKTSMQWMALPVSTVNTIRLAGAVMREPEREGIIPGGGAS